MGYYRIAANTFNVIYALPVGLRTVFQQRQADGQ